MLLTLMVSAVEDQNAPIIHLIEEARTLVMAHAGTSNSRDAVDKRVKNQTGKLLNSQDEVGGWSKLNSKPTSKGQDRDGMADDWEKSNDLTPKDPRDKNHDSDGDGYTNLEEYLNSLVTHDKKVKCLDSNWFMTGD